MKRSLRFLLNLFWRSTPLLFLFIVFGGVVLHFFIKDGPLTHHGKGWVLSVAYYGLPVRLIAGLSWVWFGLAAAQKIWRPHQILSLVSALSLTAYCLWSPSGFMGEVRKPTLVFWNLDHGDLPLSEVTDFIKTQDAGIYTFVECFDDLHTAFTNGSLEKRLPKHQAHYFGGGLALVTGKDQTVTAVTKKESNLYRFAKVQVGELRVCIVDIFSHPWLDRRIALADLADFAADCDLVSGDFNTPYDSTHMASLIAEFDCGRTDVPTNRETWPRPLPLLSLDHIFVKKGREIIAYQPVKKWATDHSPVAVQLER